MPRTKPLPRPSRLSQILKSLKQHPKPVLPSLKSLKLTFAARNDHFGARHFVKDDLPIIQYANPSLLIHVDKIPRSIRDTWNAEMLLEFRNGTQTTIDVSDMWSTSIFEELMKRAGGDVWRSYIEERRAAGREPNIPTPKARSTPPPSVPKEGITSALP